VSGSQIGFQVATHYFKLHQSKKMTDVCNLLVITFQKARRCMKQNSNCTVVPFEQSAQLITNSYIVSCHLSQETITACFVQVPSKV